MKQRRTVLVVSSSAADERGDFGWVEGGSYLAERR